MSTATAWAALAESVHVLAGRSTCHLNARLKQLNSSAPVPDGDVTVIDVTHGPVRIAVSFTANVSRRPGASSYLLLKFCGGFCEVCCVTASCATFGSLVGLITSMPRFTPAWSSA